MQMRMLLLAVLIAVPQTQIGAQALGVADTPSIGSTIQMKDAHGNLEPCTVVGIEADFGAARSAGRPFVSCPNELAEASRRSHSRMAQFRGTLARAFKAIF